jgi:hypothetical protein
MPTTRPAGGPASSFQLLCLESQEYSSFYGMRRGSYDNATPFYIEYRWHALAVFIVPRASESVNQVE